MKTIKERFESKIIKTVDTLMAEKIANMNLKELINLLRFVNRRIMDWNDKNVGNHSISEE